MDKRILFTTIILGMGLSACADRGNQAMRTDVPKQRLHVLKFPSLEKVTEADTCANVTVRLKQVPNSLQFCTSDQYHGKPYFYKLDEKNWKLSLLDSPPALKSGENGLPINQRYSVKRTPASRTATRFEIYDCDRLIGEVPPGLPHTRGNEPYLFYFFNNGQSLAFASGRDGATWSDINVIADISHPQPKNYSASDQGSHIFGEIFGDPSSADCFFYTDKDKQGNCFLNKFEHGKLIHQFVDLGQMPRADFDRTAYDKQSNRIVITQHKGFVTNKVKGVDVRVIEPFPELIVIDAKTGKIQARSEISAGLAKSSLTFMGKVGNTYLALLGPNLIDLQSVKVVASLPYSSDPAKSLDAQSEPLEQVSVGVGETALAKDNRTLLYAGYDYTEPSTIKLVSYDLLEHKVKHTASLNGPWKPGWPTVFSINIAPDGTVLVFSGTAAVFLNY